jgi:hypothetical protein
MTDKQLQKLMDRTFKSAVKHEEFLSKLTDEYVGRFGFKPYQGDDELFYNTFEQAQGSSITVEELTQSAKDAKDFIEKYS